MVTYTPPLARWLLEHHERLCRTLAERALGTDTEHAVTLAAPPTQSGVSTSTIASGAERGVTSPDPPSDTEAVVRLHTHPINAQVTFSTRDIVAFVRSTLQTTPYGRSPQGPRGYGVIGWRGDDVEAGEAHLQTLEPTDGWADLGVLERDRVQRRVVGQASSARTAQETNPLFDLLDGYVRRSSVEFFTDETPGRAQ
jgi:hypothetical protein